MIGNSHPVAVGLRIFAALVLIGALYRLYVYLEAFRLGAISPLDYLVMLIVSIAIPAALWFAAKLVDRKASVPDKNNA